MGPALFFAAACDLSRRHPPSDRLGGTSCSCRSAVVGCKLRLLRVHGLLRKLPHTHRYLVTESGRAILTALMAAQEASTEKLTTVLAA